MSSKYERLPPEYLPELLTRTSENIAAGMHPIRAEQLAWWKTVDIWLEDEERRIWDEKWKAPNAPTSGAGKKKSPTSRRALSTFY